MKIVIFVENREELAQRVREELDVQVILGKGSSPSLLRKAGDTLFLVTLPGTLREVLARFGKPYEATRRVMIFGGSRTGEILAGRLNQKGIQVRLEHF